LEIDFFYSLGKHGIVRCIDDPLISKNIEKTPLCDHLGDFWVIMQRYDFGMLAQLARTWKRQEPLGSFRTGNHRADFRQRVITLFRNRIRLLDRVSKPTEFQRIF